MYLICEKIQPWRETKIACIVKHPRQLWVINALTKKYQMRKSSVKDHFACKSIEQCLVEWLEDFKDEVFLRLAQ